MAGTDNALRYSGQVNDTAVSVMRDTGSTACMVRSSLVEPEQVTGSYDWCVLVDGTMKRYHTAVVEPDTPYYSGIHVA